MNTFAQGGGYGINWNYLPERQYFDYRRTNGSFQPDKVEGFQSEAECRMTKRITSQKSAANGQREAVVLGRGCRMKGSLQSGTLHQSSIVRFA